MNWPHICMNPEILRLGRIKAAPKTKTKITIPLDKNLSFIKPPLKLTGEVLPPLSFLYEPSLSLLLASCRQRKPDRCGGTRFPVYLPRQHPHRECCRQSFQ